MKILDKYILKFYLSRFIAVFAICFLIFIIQTFWLYIDELAGKGLDIFTIGKFFIYFSPKLVPLVLPLSILLASLTTYGTLSENYEFIAMKSNGISIVRSMVALLIFHIFLGIGSFYFSNHVVTYGELKSYNLRKNLAFDIEEVKKKEINKNLKISSSEIRNEILKGNLSKVNMMLGYSYSIKGEVIKGDGIGKKLNFPTANIKIHNEDKILPSDGVYAGYAINSDKKFIGMINIGKRPTVEGKERRVEMNIFDYNDMLYGKEMKISFIKRIRNEQKFKNLDDLSNQLRKDKLETIKIIENEEI